MTRPELNGALSPSQVFEIVRKYGARIGVPQLAPHDLRRTCARLAREGGASLESVQRTLGHASVQTTERYVNSMQAADAGDWIKVERKEEEK